MNLRIAILVIGLITCSKSVAQTSPNIQPIFIDNDENFKGFETIEISNEKLFVLAEHWHNIRSAPKATLKVLKYLHGAGNVRILAIEQGASVAHMINQYLLTGDTVMLQHITRNTMFWGKENRAFLWDLRKFNQSLTPSDRITVKSIDIEYKMESAIFVINQLIGEEKNIPTSLNSTIGEFKRIYDETKAHREQYDGLSIMFYYDQDFVQQLLINTINDLDTNSQAYIDFFGDNFSQFASMILEMDDGLTFDYTNPNTNYKFRDRIIYQKFEELVQENPEQGILCVIGMRHATKGSSIHDLKSNENSPLKDQVITIRLSALLNKNINSGDLRKINFNYPKQLKNNQATIIRHDASNPLLKSKSGFDYTLFINSSGNLTPYENVLTEEY